MATWRAITKYIDVDTLDEIEGKPDSKEYQTITILKEKEYEHKWENRVRVTYGITKYTRFCRRIPKQGRLFD